MFSTTTFLDGVTILDPVRLDTVSALVIGFVFAGLACSAFEAFARRRVGLALLETGDGRALASVPVLVFAAPLVILRSSLAPGRVGRGSFGAVFLATIVAGLWSLASGRVVLDVATLLLRV